LITSAQTACDVDWWLADEEKASLDDISDGPSEMTSQSNDSSSVTTTVAGSNETSRRGRRNRRDRHKNGNKSSMDSVTQPNEAEPRTHSTLSPGDSLLSGRNKSSVNNSSMSNVVGRETSLRGSVLEPVKLTSLNVCPPAPASITGN